MEPRWLNFLVPSDHEFTNHQLHIMSKDILPNLTRNLISGKDLSADEARTAALALADSGPDPDDKSKFLVALKQKGESLSLIHISEPTRPY